MAKNARNITNIVRYNYYNSMVYLLIPPLFHQKKRLGMSHRETFSLAYSAKRYLQMGSFWLNCTYQAVGPRINRGTDGMG